ncbi:MAG: hypothetical protein IPM17_06520 [Verrucomicrobia bacterium]|nr:hypothetical protein [Verrucomicrobiota bacterium]
MDSDLPEGASAEAHAAAAQAARQQAIQAYLAYRRAGGVSESHRARRFERVLKAVQQNQPREASESLNQLAAYPGATPNAEALIAKLRSILAGDRNPALAANPAHHWLDAAELHRLPERLLPR